MTRRTDERGTFIVLWALLISALLGMAAIVIDLGALRQDRRVGRAATDAAATAAANDLGRGDVGAACATAWGFLKDALGHSGSSPCPPAGTTCETGLNTTVTLGRYTVTMQVPVADTDPVFMTAESIGGDRSQPAVANVDGTDACRRFGVRVRSSRTSTFAGVLGVSSGATDVHSVALYKEATGSAASVPALIALNKTLCPAVDTDNGTIHVYANGPKPGVVYADSDATGPTCPTSAAFMVKTTGTLQADPGSTGTPGEFGSIAPLSPVNKAFGGAGSYIGSKVWRPSPITRTPADRRFHCGVVSPVPIGCTTGAAGNDFISSVQTQYGAGVPAGFTTFPAAGQNCLAPPMTFLAGKWYIDCPTFAVNSPVSFTSGDIVFNGNITLGSGGVLNINAANTTDSTVVVRGVNGVSTGSNTWSGTWNRTAMVMTNTLCQTAHVSCGRWDVSNGNLTWTAPSGGLAKDLLYWTESTQNHNFQGNPTYNWRGVFFVGRSQLNLQGNVVLDVSHVQLWVDNVKLNNNSGRLYLRPDPDRSIAVGHSGSMLIR